MVKKYILLFLTVLSGSVFAQLQAQDTLPHFSVRNVGNNRIIISWANNYQKVKQISIQRSFDSLKNYKTILTVPDPMNRENGYVDTRAANDHMFYRLFIMLDGAMYIFSAAKQPFIDTVRAAVKKKIDPFSVDVNRPGKNIDSTIKEEGYDSKNKPNIYIPSIFVYTAKDGNVHLNLPDVTTKKYWVKFYDENDNFLFEIKNLKESSLIVDKSNFYHAGWFSFELYVDEKLKEKNKFLLQREF